MKFKRPPLTVSTIVTVSKKLCIFASQNSVAAITH